MEQLAATSKNVEPSPSILLGAIHRVRTASRTLTVTTTATAQAARRKIRTSAPVGDRCSV